MSTVPKLPPTLITDVNPIRAGNRIRGPGQFQNQGRALTWLMAKGSQLVNDGAFVGDVVAPGSFLQFRYYVWPHEQNVTRLWFVNLSSTGATGTFEAPSGATGQKWTCSLAYTAIPFVFYEVVSSPSSTPGGTHVKVLSDASSQFDTYVLGISCVELPPQTLTTFSASDVIQDYSLASQQPIYEGTVRAVSCDGLNLLAANAVEEARRGALFSWYNPNGITSTASSAPGTGNVLAIDIPVNARHLYNGQTTRDMAVAVYAKATGGGASGRVKFTASKTADTETLTVTSVDWYTGTLSCTTEDLSQPAALRSSTRERIRVEIWKTAGTSITIYGICIGEAP